MEKIKQEAIELLNNCEVATLASIDEQGYPRPIVISKIKTDGIDTIWFSTGTSSEKTKNFIENPKAGVAFFKEGDADRHHRSSRRRYGKESIMGRLVL